MLKIIKNLLPIFFVSGMTGLIYQVVWQRILTLYYGLGHISTTIIVSIFMLGLGLGALVGGRYIDLTKNKLKIYSVIELLIGLFGFASIPILNFIGKNTAGSDYYLTFFYIFIFLAVPTFLMGTTLPILCRILNDIKPNFFKNISILYFINALGASFGTIFASFVLISFFGLDKAVYFSASINIILALLIYTVMKKYPVRDVYLPENKQPKLKLRSAHILVFVTGFIALGYEIVWFRLISILTQSSPYAFSSSLFVYLFGVSLGSYLMWKLIRKYPFLYSKSNFYLLQFFIAVAVAITIILFYYGNLYTPLSLVTKAGFNFHPHPYMDLKPLGYHGYEGYKFISVPWEKPLDTFNYDSKILAFFVVLYQNFDMFIWSFFFILIPTLLMGASFPLVTSLTNSNINKTGTTVGSIYFFNVSGNVIGTLAIGFVFLPLIGTIGTILIMVIIGILFFLFVKSGKILKFLAILLVFILFLIIPSNKNFYSVIHQATNEQVYVEEGIDGVVVTLESPEKMWTYINGAYEAHRPGYTYYANIPNLLSYSNKPKDILIIGLGMATSTELMLQVDNARVTVVEISPSLIKNLQKIEETNKILKNPKLNLIIDDGRRFLYRTDKKYDIIAMEPVRVRQAYSGNIYSKEFFELIRSHLKEGGVFQVLIDRDYEILPNTLINVFNYVNLYPFRAIASDRPLIKHNPPIMVPKKYLAEVGKFNITTQIIYNQDELKSMLKGKKLNTDYYPLLEYFIWEAFSDEKR